MRCRAIHSNFFYRKSKKRFPLLSLMQLLLSMRCRFQLNPPSTKSINKCVSCKTKRFFCQKILLLKAAYKIKLPSQPGSTNFTGLSQHESKHFITETVSISLWHTQQQNQFNLQPFSKKSVIGLALISCW